MKALSIGELARRATQRAGAKRSYDPVRRHSREKGTFETTWYRTPKRGQYGLMCDGVRVVDEHLKKKQPGMRAGPLGHVSDKVIRVMNEAQDRITGRLDVSYDWLCAKTGYSRPTVARSLKALVEYGFLEIQRRCVRRDVPNGEAGPRWRQATNAYRLKMPALARRLLGLRGKEAPSPTDETDRYHFHAEAAEAMLAALAADEIGGAVTTDKALAAILNRMGRHFVRSTNECELIELPQSVPFSFDRAGKEE